MSSYPNKSSRDGVILLVLLQGLNVLYPFLLQFPGSFVLSSSRVCLKPVVRLPNGLVGGRGGKFIHLIGLGERHFNRPSEQFSPVHVKDSFLCILRLLKLDKAKATVHTFFVIHGLVRKQT
jgi:hypothetical protein